jgi:hypothetical protein
MTASSIYGLPVARLGTELMLERLTPFQNSNRIPVTLVDALVPDLTSLALWENVPSHVAVTDINALVVAVGYAMQPVRLPARRSEVVSFLRAHYENQSRYFKRRRLTQLRLPDSLLAPPPPSRSTLRRRFRRLARRAPQTLGRWLLGASSRAHAPMNSRMDRSPVVHLPRPITTPDTRTFAASEGARTRPSESRPASTVPPGSPRGTPLVCEGHA